MEAKWITRANVDALLDAGKIEVAFINEDSRDEFERWIKEFGAWDRDEITAWSLDECNVLLIQFISGDLREIESLCPSNDDEFGIDWDEARRLSEKGVIGGHIYPGSNGHIYFYIGH